MVNIKNKIVLSILLVFFIIFAASSVFAAVNNVSIPEFINSIIRYEFNSITDTPDTGSGLGDFSVTHNGTMVFTPVDLTEGWLFELADGNALDVEIGTLSSGDRYIDITGKNGNVRYLNNSGSACDGYNMTQFWSAKQQEGSSIIKDFNGEIKCAVLYEFPNGSCYLSGYIEGDGTNFWTLGLPTANYFCFINDSVSTINKEENISEIEAVIDKKLEIIMSSPDYSSNANDYIKAHQAEYEEIIAMADTALPYLYSIWEADKGLRGVIALTAIFEIQPEINIHAVYSPDGKYCAETKGIQFDNQISGLYTAKEMRIIELDTQNVVWNVTPGYLDTIFMWSPDSRYLAVSYMARIYRETIVIDTYDMSLVDIPQMNDLWPLIGSYSEPKADRADPYFTVIEWVNETEIRLSYKWTGKDENEYSGEYTYALAIKRIVEVK